MTEDIVLDTREARTGRSLDPRVLLLGYAVDEDRMIDLCRVDRYPAMQTHRFTWKLIRGLESAIRTPIDIASFAPVSDYPSSPFIRFRRRSWTRPEGSRVDELPFLNLKVFKHLTRFVSATRALLAWSTSGERRESIVICYGLASGSLFAAVLSRVIRGFTLVVLISDAPGVSLPGESRLVSVLRRIDAYLVRLALSFADGVITLTQDLRESLTPSLPYLVVDGIVENCAPNAVLNNVPSIPHANSKRETFVITYAGALQDGYGIENLIEAVRRTPDPSLRLVLLGKGSLTGVVQRATEQDTRISYPGFLTGSAYASHLASADLLAVPRPSASEGWRFGVPSKLFEYMVTGRPVAVTRAPGLPSDLCDHLNFLGDGSVDAIASSIAEIRRTPEQQRLERAARLRAHVCATRNVVAQGSRVWQFLTSLAAGSGR